MNMTVTVKVNRVSPDHRNILDAGVERDTNVLAHPHINQLLQLLTGRAIMIPPSSFSFNISIDTYGLLSITSLSDVELENVFPHLDFILS